MENLNYGDFLRKARKARDLSQEQFAELIGISQTTYSRIENGLVIPSQEIYDKITAALARSKPVLTPEVEAFDYTGQATSRGIVAGRTQSQKTLYIISTIIKLAFALLLIDAAYDFGQGFSEGIQAPANAKNFIGTISVIITMVVYYYWLKRLEKRWQL